MLPVPMHDEPRETFIQRCTNEPQVIEDFPDAKERNAVCSRQWKRSPAGSPGNKDDEGGGGGGGGGTVGGVPVPVPIAVSRRTCVLASNGDAAPTRILVFKDGANAAKWDDGEELLCVVDQQAADAIVAAFKALGRDQIFDYEHQSERPGIHPAGKAPAAGWITGYEFVAGEGLYANVNWTDDATAEIKKRQYRYFSPAFYTDDNNRVTEITSIALTNSPALIGLRAIAASRTKDPKHMKKLCALLGLPDTATEDQIIAAINSRPSADALATEIATAAGIDGKGKDAVIASVKSLREKGANIDPTKWVARADYDTLSTRVQSLETDVATRERDKFLADGQTAGKITSANRELWEAAYKADTANARKLMDNAPVLVHTGQLTGPTKPATAPTTRAAIIASAAAEYDGDETHRKFCSSRERFVAGALRTENMSPLTEDERKQVAA